MAVGAETAIRLWLPDVRWMGETKARSGVPGWGTAKGPFLMTKDCKGVMEGKRDVV